MIQKPFPFVFEPILKLEKVAIIDQNGKALVFTFWPFFQLLKNGLKRPKSRKESL